MRNSSDASSRRTHLAERLEPRCLLADVSLFADLSLAGIEPRDLHVLGNRLLFTANHPKFGRELWRSDGTAAGTGIIKDLYPGKFGANYYEFCVAGSFLYFTGNDFSGQRGLFRTDGTEQGTIFLHEFPGVDSQPGTRDLVAFQDKLYFLNRDVWTSDGTPQGTHEVADLLGSDEDFREITMLTSSGSSLYFFNYQSAYPLWKSDGTAAGTRRLSRIYPANYVEQLGTAAGHYFINSTMRNDPYDRLWVTDRTLGLVSLDRVIAGSNFVTVGEAAYFIGKERATRRPALWRYEAGALTKVLSGSDSFGPLVESRGRILHTRSDGGLYLYDPTTQSNTLLSDFSDVGVPMNLVAASRGRVFFHLKIGSRQASRFVLWGTDGTVNGTHAIAELNVPVGQYGDAPPAVVTIGKSAYFATKDPSGALELFAADGSQRGKRQVYDQFGDPADSAPTDLAVAGSSLYFLTQVPGGNPYLESGARLWRTDGRTAPVLIRSFPGSERFTGLGAIGSTYFFAAHSLESGKFDILRSDGTAKSTKVVKTIKSQLLVPFGLINNRLLIEAYTDNGHALWSTDGTPDGTSEILAVNGFPNESFRFPTFFGGSVYFATSDDGFALRTLIRTDGTVGGTADLSAWFDGQQFDGFAGMISHNNRLVIWGNGSNFPEVSSHIIFEANATGIVGVTAGPNSVAAIASLGSKLVILENEPANTISPPASGITVYAADRPSGARTRIANFPQGYEARWTTTLNGVAYFDFGDNSSLWTTDGTTAGTTSLRVGHSKFATYNGQYYFTNRIDHTIMAASKDGRSASTVVSLGRSEAAPDEMTVFDGRMYFAAWSKSFGRELHTLTTGGTVAGNVFGDLNASGAQDSGETGLSGWRAYVDLNRDGTFDLGEPTARTSSSGRFEIFGVPAGRYLLTVSLIDGYAFSGASSYTLNVIDGAVVSRRFGAQRIA